MIEIRVYFEGNQALRPGFRTFFKDIDDSARKRKCRFELISCGADWRREFSHAIKRHPAAYNVLLIDSDRPLADGRAAEECTRNGWDRSHVDSIFWMVEMMESWFHADKDALAKYYGEGFNRKALAANPSIEQIPKKDLEDGLKNATRNTQKGPYHKTAHAPKLLERIQPALVRKAHNCNRIFQSLEARLNTYGHS